MSNENQTPTTEPTSEARTAATLATIKIAELIEAYQSVGFDAATAAQHARTNADRFRVEIAPDPTDPARLHPIVVDASGRTAGDILSQEYAFSSHMLQMKRFHDENSMGLHPVRPPVQAPPEGINPLTRRPSPPASHRNVPISAAAAIAFGMTQQGK